MFKRKLIAGLAAAVLFAASMQGGIVQALAQPVETISAVDESDLFEESATASLIQEGAYPQQSDEVCFNYDASWESAKEALADGMRGLSESINIADYKISRNQLVSLYEEAINENPDLFYVSCNFTYNYIGSDNTVTYVKPSYIGKQSEIYEMRIEFEKAVQTLVANVDSTLSDAEIALQVHDYIIAHADYAATQVSSGSTSTLSHSAYGALVENLCVCDGYALAYNYILNNCYGITSLIITSDSMSHAWNQVKIGDSYYHVDLTFDDPTKDNNDSNAYSVYHEYFLCSDANIQSKDIHGSGAHYGWSSNGITCDSTSYDGLAFKPVNSQDNSRALYAMSTANGKWYYTDLKTEYNLVEYDFATDTATSVKLGTNVYPSYVAADENGLYYAERNKKEIYFYDFETSQISRVYTAESVVAGLYFDDGVLMYCNGKATYATGIEKNDDNKVATESIKLSESSLKLNPGETVQLTAELLPEDSTDVYVSWISSDESVARVVNGAVTGVSAGDVTITAAVGDVSAECTVTIAQAVENVTVYNGIDYSAVYNAQYYYNNYADLRAVFGNDSAALLAHFVEYGMAEGRQASDKFSVYSYRAFNADLQSAFDTNLKAYYIHYINYGKSENRDAVGEYSLTSYMGMDYSDVYSADYYMTQYKDLQNAFGDDYYLYIKHFVEYGMAEGRIASEDFDPVVYAQSYPDLVAAFGDNMKMYYIHYIKNGKAEGRVISKTVYNGTDYEAVFDYEYYKNSYSDLREAFNDNSRAYLEHFVNYGMQEGRNACEDFDIEYYSTAYEDLQNAFGSNLKEYYLHYINYGKAEGRVALLLESDSEVLTAGSIGIDVSHHQGKVDWEAVKEDGISFAVIRVGYGNDEETQDDATAAYNISECERLNIPYGVYLYSYAVSEEEAQSEAEHLLRLIDGHEPQLGVYIDIEDTDYYEKNGGFDVYSEEGAQRVTLYAKIIMEAVAEAGYEAGIYADYDYYINVLDTEMLEGYRWVALWNDENQKDVDDLGAFIWQYTSSGEVNGVEGAVDMDMLMKDVTLKKTQSESSN
jgi:GH25 family lysozyme M1 (1,4-beta-N-acetylmuramidase)/uncharacterized protein YjdB